ncbi:hypothetical protein AB0L41_00990 [Amycolatopsis mediterranei]|uniref:hypothetical protein n=1 Tax=Amycolatopsis mediterranei TaxID=33910 RepID=UPI00342BF8DB
MSDQDEALAQIGKRFLEAVFCSSVEAGEIEIEERTFGEIVKSFKQILAADSAGDAMAYIPMPKLDYRETLLEKAAAETKSGHLEISVTLYATWLEHVINGLLESGCARKGFSHATYLSLIRELRFGTKLRALWEIVNLPPLPEEKLRAIDHAIGLRNSFVHYKWPAHDVAGHDDRAAEFRRAVSEFESLVVFFDEIENAYFWSGRREELLIDFRKSIDEELARRPFKLGDLA